MSVRPGTLAVHAGASGLAPPIEPASVYAFRSLRDLKRAPKRAPYRYYRRYGNPNGRALEEAMAALEGTEDALATSSGIAAIFSVLAAHSRAGDRIVASRDLYGGTYQLLTQDVARLGVEVVFCENRPGAFARALRRGARWAVVETITNPLIRATAVRRIADAAHRAGARLLVDNTLATPVLRRPVREGADVVVHSATKFLGGHADAVAGVVCGPQAVVAPARRFAISVGLTVSPLDAWLVLRGLRTLHLRITRSQSNARAVARFLRGRRVVSRVYYCGFGPMVSFELRGGAKAARAFLRATRLVAIAPSLGDVATTSAHPASTSHAYLPRAVREAAGIGDGLVRLSVGVEDAADIIGDLRQALRRIP